MVNATRLGRATQRGVGCWATDGGSAVVCCDLASTAEWLAQEIAKAFPWNTAPVYLVRDSDGAYGQAFSRRVRAMMDPLPTNITASAIAESIC
jgi:hypothetical protein